MGANLAKIRNEVLKVQSGGGRVRYSEKIKKAVLDALASGIKPSEISGATGLNAPVIFKWRQRSQKTFRALRVSASEAVGATSSISIFLREIMGILR
jgi:transposase-like protein